MRYSQFNAADLATYEQDGYVIKKDFFSAEEIDLLYRTATHDDLLRNKAFNLNDQQGFKTRLTLWYTPGDDIYGNYSRCARLYDAVEIILGGLPAHYHSKLMQKEPRVGGAWEWHQDYGYWYKNGFLFPDMVSVMVALTRANRANGCLQVIKGSHKMNRIEHGFAGEQVGADQERVDEALKQMELVYVELEPGDTLFFHCNILHRSEMNGSEYSRWSLISAYNLATNKPFKDEPASSYTPITKVPDAAILEKGAQGISANADFLAKENERAIQQ